MKSSNPRETALDMLIDIFENDKFSHIVLREGLHTIEDRQEKAFITRLVMGTVERVITIDYIINSYSKVKVKKMKPLIRELLRMSVYQIHYMEAIPDSAVCNEAVKIAKKRKFVNLSGFVNGVLRKIGREKDNFVIPQNDDVNSLSIRYSTPTWIVEKCIKDYGMDICKKILSGSDENSFVSVRVNTSKASVAQVRKELSEENIEYSDGDYLEEAIKLHHINDIESIDAFRKGFIQPQDESSMLVGRCAGIEENDICIDVCSAPGGKAIHVADLLKGTGKVYSRDVSEYKVNLINQNIKRSGFSNIEAGVFDATVSDESMFEKADVLIADVPCSGLGVFNKKSDIKYKITEESLEELRLLQRRIIENVHKYVKPGGVMIYSTCTINQEENIENVNWITKNFDFRLESIDEYIPEKLRNEDTKKGFLQLIQGVHQCDGFFIARLRRGKN